MRRVTHFRASLRFTTAAVLVLGLSAGGQALALGERPAPPKAEVAPAKPVAVAQPVKAKPVPKPAAKAHKKDPSRTHPVKKAPVKKPLAAPSVPKPVYTHPSPGMKYDIGHMPVPASVASPVQAGGTAEGLMHPSPALTDAPVLPATMPPEVMASARPGQCFAELKGAPVTEMVDANVMVKPSVKVRREFPARSEWVDEEVVIHQARTQTRHVPATYRLIKETVVISVGGVREELIPAQYEIRSEREMVAPERQEWVFVPAAPTGEKKLTWNGKTPEGQWCLQTLPAQYREVEHRVEIRPSEVRRIELAPVTQVIERRIVDVPAHEEIVEIPAVTGLRKVKKLIEPAHADEVVTDAVYETRKEKREVSPGAPVWSEVLCVKKASVVVVKRIQTALKASGYYKGKPDGVLGQRTTEAMDAYQAANGLPRGAITVAGLKALGVY
jgi:hypothetical protein